MSKNTNIVHARIRIFFFFGQTIFILLNAAKIDACVVWDFFLATGKGPQILIGEKKFSLDL